MSVVASVVVPTRDRHDDLRRCVRAIASQQTSRAFELIVVDDGSSPPVEPSDLGYDGPLQILRTGGRGPAAARNAGFREARAPVVLFTDDDTEPLPGWLESACAYLEEHGEDIGVEGPVTSPPWDPLSAYSLFNTLPGACWTCNIAFRRAALLDVGGFDEEFPYPAFEDLDLVFRLHELGDVGFAEEMGIVHHPRSQTVRGLARRGRFAASELRLYAKHPDKQGPRRRPLRRFGPLISSVLYTRRLARGAGSSLRRPDRFLRLAAIAVWHFAYALASVLRYRGPLPPWRRAA